MKKISYRRQTLRLTVKIPAVYDINTLFFFVYMHLHVCTEARQCLYNAFRLCAPITLHEFYYRSDIWLQHSRNLNGTKTTRWCYRSSSSAIKTAIFKQTVLWTRVWLVKPCDKLETCPRCTLVWYVMGQTPAHCDPVQVKCWRGGEDVCRCGWMDCTNRLIHSARKD